MSEFDDPDLRQQLARLSGPYPDDNVAFDAWQRRVGQARRRRAVVWTTGAALSLLVGTVGVAALNNPARHTLVPGKSADSSADVSISSTTEAKDSSTTESTEPSTTESTVVETTPITEAMDTSVPETEVQATQPAANGSNGGPPKTHAPATSTAPVATPAPSGDSTFPSPGGSITVRRDGDRLTVVATAPAGGFEVTENKRSGNRVEVTFESNDHRFTISVRVVDGVVTPSISDKGKEHQDSVPGSTDERGHGDGDN
jgi:cytoskeletal protein RodZ